MLLPRNVPKSQSKDGGYKTRITQALRRCVEEKTRKGGGGIGSVSLILRFRKKGGKVYLRAGE